MPSWFEKLVGFPEDSPDQVRENIKIVGNKLTSNVNGKQYLHGKMEILSLSELKERVRSAYEIDKTCSLSDASITCSKNLITVRELVADVQDLHADRNNAGALFQVASQFNLLEMVSPNVNPEAGVGRYEQDHTQGPACAIACGAGTIYRNYFIPITTENGTAQIGQSKAYQVDCLAHLGSYLGNDDGHLWKMKNGYCLSKTDGLKEISNRLKTASNDELNKLRGLLKIGIMWDTQVTISPNYDNDEGKTNDGEHCVTQAYCSALPIAYSILQSQTQWKDFATLILDSAYEATMCSAILNMKRSAGEQSNKVFLTLLGGGAFGNDDEWIFSAIKRAIQLYSQYGLDVSIVSYGQSNSKVQKLIGELEMK